jgi:hypothetical protein
MALGVGAGNIGLQQSLRLDPVGFATNYPIAVVLSLAAALTVAWLFARTQRTSRRFAFAGALAVLLGDAAASFVVAPVLVGELEPEHGVIVLVAISLFGSQIVAALAGAALGGAQSERSAA